MAAPSSDSGGSTGRAAVAAASWVSHLNDNDVQLGRGRPIITSEGNQRLRKLILENKAAYSASGKHAVKDEIARRILTTIAERGGSFVRKLESPRKRQLLGVKGDGPAWMIVDEEASLQKVKQALREQDQPKAASSPTADRKGGVARTAGTESGGGRKRKNRSDLDEKPKAVVHHPSPHNHPQAQGTFQSSLLQQEHSSRRDEPQVSSVATVALHGPAQPNESPVEGAAAAADDLSFRLKHPSLRKRDMSRLRRQQETSDDQGMRASRATTSSALPESAVAVALLEGSGAHQPSSPLHPMAKAPADDDGGGSGGSTRSSGVQSPALEKNQKAPPSKDGNADGN